jgi:hypothetical protein
MLVFVRYVLPAVICLAGVILIALDPGGVGLEGGLAVIGAGLSVALLNFLHRIGVSGEGERDEEEEARRFYDEHGRWPDGRRW